MRLRIVIGYKANGSPESLYVGDSGQEAAAVYDSVRAPEFSRVEYFQFPQAAKRKSLSVQPIPAAVVVEPEQADDDNAEEAAETVKRKYTRRN